MKGCFPYEAGAVPPALSTTFGAIDGSRFDEYGPSAGKTGNNPVAARAFLSEKPSHGFVQTSGRDQAVGVRRLAAGGCEDREGKMDQAVAGTDLMRAVLDEQRRCSREEEPASEALRRDRLRRLLAMTLDAQDRIIAAVRADYSGMRSPREIAVMDLLPSVSGLKHALSHLSRWMRPERRRPNFPFGLMGAKARVVHSPKGTVGIIAPWNVPYGLAIAPATGAFAAGNRLMLKPSELAPATADLLKDLVETRFDAAECAVFPGGVEVATAFTHLPLDHLVFTGSTATGRRVLAAAAENLVPVTLELGGKSPAIIGASASLGRTLESLVLGKMLNAGQICMAPDYVLVPAGSEDAFVQAAAAKARDLFPGVSDNPDYGVIIDAAKHERLKALVADAAAKGARVSVAADADGDNSRRMPLHLLQNVTDSMLVMQEEIFGPVLPVIGYRSFAEALAIVGARPAPLALYYFGSDASEKAAVIARTRSGGVTINDTHHHNLQDDLPFGGVGASGMGRYHGQHGFLEFSHPRAIYEQTRVDIMGKVGFRPPYGATFDKFLRSRIR